MRQKTLFFYIIFFAVLHNSAGAHGRTQESHLNWVEVTDNRLSTQIMLDFSGPVKFKTNINENKHQLNLIFDNMNESMFRSKHVQAKLTHLKSQGIVNTVTISQSKGKRTKLTLSIQFAARDRQKRKNKFMVKSSCVQHESNNKIIIDIYTQKKLDTIAHKNKILLQASNNRKGISTSPRKRIMIDPGHGGKQPGARGFGLVEKNIALDISRRVYKKLKQAGHSVLLTRSRDQSLTLLERNKLAHQLKADMLISIHANSAGTIGSSASGIETYYIKDTLASSKSDAWLSVNMNKNRTAKKLRTLLGNQHTQSKKLASNIQTGIFSSLEKNKQKTRNRGIKPQIFRLFLRSQVPTALVEVGFITNKKEANLLKKSPYKQTLANGIYNGIISTLKNL